MLEAHIELIERRNPASTRSSPPASSAARAEADAADAAVAKAGKRKSSPPFLGVPVTIKESFAVEGMPNTAGSLDREHVVAEHSATAVRRLVDAGRDPARRHRTPPS